MNHNWKYGILDYAVTKGSSNLSLNKIKGDEGNYPVFGAKGYLQNVSFYQQDIEYLAIIKDGAGVGRVSKHPAKSSILATMQYIIPKDGFDIQFLSYFLSYIDFDKYRTGSTIPHIYYKDYKSEPFPLIDLPEQKRIVAILDRCFEAIDKAKANVERNLQNAKDLFQSQLNQIFTQNGEGWVEKKLGDVVENTCSLSYGIVQPGPDVPDGLPIVRPTDLSDTVIHSHGLKRIDPSLADGYKRTILSGGELLLCVRGSTGTVSVASMELAGSNVTRGIVPIRFEESIVSQRFGYFQFISGYIQSQIKAKTYGAALMQINIRDLRMIDIVIAPAVDQNIIVRTIGSLSENVVRLESKYQQELDALDELKKSILQKAFNGELTETEEAA